MKRHCKIARVKNKDGVILKNHEIIEHAKSLKAKVEIVAIVKREKP